uniref:Uncharacterized protein n=1 Tax=Strongyloides stercoralis TaxID=6248 RepID=A0A0K0DYV3_STRER
MVEECSHVQLNTFQLFFIDTVNQKDSLKVAGTLLFTTSEKILQDTNEFPCLECLKCISSVLLDFNNFKPLPKSIFKEQKWPRELGKVLERIIKTKNIEYNYITLAFNIISQLFYLTDDLWLQGNNEFFILIISLFEVRFRMILGDYDKINIEDLNDVCDIFEFVINEIENGNYMDSLATKISFLVQKSISFLCEWIYEIYMEKLTINKKVEERIYMLIIEFFSIGGCDMINGTILKYAIKALQPISLRYLREHFSKGRSLVCILTNSSSLPDSTLKFLLEYVNFSLENGHQNALDDLYLILSEFKDRCDFYNTSSLEELKRLSERINNDKIKEIVEKL